MLSNSPKPQTSNRPAWQRVVVTALVVVLVVLMGWWLWKWANDMAGIKRQVPKEPMLIPLPPPPPLPEPKPPAEEEPKEEELVEPEPEPIDKPQPQDEVPPTPSDPLSDPMQMNGEAQAGTDSFNIGAGQGRGMGGSGGGRAGNATYSQYLAYALQKILREDSRTRNLVYRVQVRLWLTADGAITRVELEKASGDSDVDAALIAALREVGQLDERPPASVSMPIRAQVTGRRPN